MPKTKLIDAFVLGISVPSGLPATEDAAIRRTLRGKRFLSAVRQAMLAVLRQYPTLRCVRCTISR